MLHPGLFCLGLFLLGLLGLALLGGVIGLAGGLSVEGLTEGSTGFLRGGLGAAGLLDGGLKVPGLCGGLGLQDGVL